MTIVIDIDDTISNFAKVLIKYLNEEYKTNYSKKDIKNWGWLNEKFSNPWKPTEDFKFWDEVIIDKDAIKCIENLVKKGNKVYLVTASFPSDTL